MAGEVNDRYWKRADYDRRRKARRAQQGLDDDDDAREEERARELEVMRQKVEDMTRKMEESVRGIIDAKAAVEGVGIVLGEVATNVVQGNGAVSATQSTLGASQFRQGRRRRGGGGAQVNDDDEGSEFEDEPSQENGQENVGPTRLLQRKLEDHKMRYDRLPLRSRYVLPHPRAIPYSHASQIQLPY